MAITYFYWMCFLAQGPSSGRRLYGYLLSSQVWAAVARLASSTTVVVALVMTLGLDAAAAQIAQSTYRFSRAPQFMLLDLYPGSNLFGYTASIWDKKIKEIVVGHVLGSDTIELAFYPSSTESKARREAFQAPICKTRPFEQPTAQCYEHFADVIRHLSTPVVASQRYVYTAHDGKQPQSWNDGAWVATDEGNKYSSFTFYRDYDIDSLEEHLFSGATKQGRGAEKFSHNAVENLFGGRIIVQIAGLPETMFYFREQHCDKTEKLLEGVLKRAGKWQVSLEPERDKHFRVLLKSHSDREYFYRAGMWWKAFIEVSFVHNNDKGQCSRARVYLYDSAVCGGPLSDDPDLSHRECFERIPFDSRAELDLRDRLRQILVREYGSPPGHDDE
jgi:hypothetical protein